MEIKASAKYVRMSPKKLRYVLDLIRGMDVAQARDQLKFIKRRASGNILKLVNSAIANAKHNFELEAENLYIKEITADKGPTLRRWRARAFGRAAPLRKRSTHLVVILEDKKKSSIKKRKVALPEPDVVKVRPKKEMEIKEGAPIDKELGKPSVAKAMEGKEEPFDVRRKGKRRTKQHLDKIGQKKKGGIIKRIFRRKAI